MKKNLQLQEWLLQKEQREIEILAIESERRSEADRDRRRKDEEFRRRAAKQKAKLKRWIFDHHRVCRSSPVVSGGD